MSFFYRVFSLLLSVFALPPPARADQIELQVLGDIELGMMAISESLGVDLAEETWKIRVERLV